MGDATVGFMRNYLQRREASSFLMPVGTPRSTLNRQINSQRRVATQQFEHKRIERLARATDSTHNEILTYLCSSTLRRFFKEYNALPEESAGQRHCRFARRTRHPYRRPGSPTAGGEAFLEGGA